MSTGQKITDFLTSLQFDVKLPRGVEIMDVYGDAQVQEIITRFYHQYFKDDAPRRMIIGINPGRFGGGITGIPFTDPVSLEAHCGINNPWKKQKELSSVFIYEMINAFGGPEAFYKKFYITAVSPLGFVKAGKNLNYYDDALLLKRIVPFVVRTLQQQLDFGIDRDRCYCIGEGENFRFLQQLNEKHQFFNDIVPLPHPRFIMQYRRKEIPAYIERYLQAFNPA